MKYTLRKWQDSDKPNLIKHANNRKIAMYLRNGFTYPYTEKAADFFLNLVKENPDQPLFAITVAGEAIGGVGLHPQKDIYRKNAEIGYWISEEYWGKGIMTNAINEILEYSWNHLDIDRVVAIIFGTNVGSIKVAEKCGFVLEATLSKTIYKFGLYEDELIYGIRRPGKEQILKGRSNSKFQEEEERINLKRKTNNSKFDSR